MPSLFGITLFLSAVLLFLIQPMTARMILPLLGGSPAVWLTCMVFFQAVLLGGYLYAHALTRRIAFRSQHAIHLLVFALPLLLLPLVSLPLHLQRDTTPLFGGMVGAWFRDLPHESTPIPWLLALLFVSVGLPAFAIATSAPLLQRWFGHSNDPRAHDPYFLYAASNAGSMVALLGYPLVVEPVLALVQQTWLWAAGYACLFLLLGACAFAMRGAGQGSGPPTNQREDMALRQSKPASSKAEQRTLTPWHRVRWAMLSFLPSSLLFGVTTYLSTDIAAVPLLWIAPLALYLLTFILAFGRKQILPHRWVGLLVPALMVAHLVFLLTQIFHVLIPLSVLLPVHLAMFFAAAYLCHGELAAARPATGHLTEFYLWLSLGGVAGGLFNAVLAPLVFTGILEYPLVLLAITALGPRLRASVLPSPGARTRGRSPAVSLISGSDLLGWFLAPTLGVAACLVMVYLQVDFPSLTGWAFAWMLGLPLVTYAAACWFSPRPLGFGVPVGILLVAAVAGLATPGILLHGERGFYGVLRVTRYYDRDRNEEFTHLFHGTTLHGKQRVTTDALQQRQPLTYYHPDGPIGQLFAAFAGTSVTRNVAVVGLGTGSLASYGQYGEKYTFYEIDPAVIRLARDSGHFTFLRTCRAQYEIIPGDARLALRHADDGQFGLLVVDAFSSDAIPAHLLTLEACRDVYLKKLRANGLMVFHISNRFLDLRPVLGKLAHSLDLVGRFRWDELGDAKTERNPSLWIVLARAEADLGTLATDNRWKPLPAAQDMRVWTDDYSNILEVMRWR